MTAIRVGILGTRGIPNSYGGFEQLAEYLSFGLVQRNFDVTVYNSRLHPFKGQTWNGVKIVRCYDPEKNLGTCGQFIYDLNCVLDSKKRGFDIILQLGYTSSSVWFKILNKCKILVTTNMDGHEWKRSKYSRPVQQFLKYAEKLAVKRSNYLIADSVIIQNYLKKKYNATSCFIPYGANVYHTPKVEDLIEYNLTPCEYDVIIARFEHENNIETILEGAAKAVCSRSMIVIGNYNNPYGEKIRKKFSKFKKIRFLHGIYDVEKLNCIRYYSYLYFHGHSVGGTNPSLLEAMASTALICAHNNQFNQAILANDAYYFDNSTDVALMLTTIDKKSETNKIKLSNNIMKIESKYNWKAIIDGYAAHFQSILENTAIKLTPKLSKEHLQFQSPRASIK